MVTTNATTAGSTSNHQRIAPDDLISSAQPLGDPQVSQRGPCGPEESPIALSRYVTPTTPIARPLADRAVPAIWAQTAATAVNTRPEPAIASASASDPAAGNPS